MHHAKVTIIPTSIFGASVKGSDLHPYTNLNGWNFLIQVESLAHLL